MRTINFSEEDIKQCKLTLTKQSLTPLQSAFLMQYITNIEQENEQLKETLDKYENPKDMTLMMMWCTEEVKDENKKLKDNWNKLKEWLDNEMENQKHTTHWDVERKMQELEQGSDSNE